MSEGRCGNAASPFRVLAAAVAPRGRAQFIYPLCRPMDSCRVGWAAGSCAGGSCAGGELIQV